MRDIPPVFSIIMPVYNTGELLNGTIECILNQTYANWELIIVDDGSKDKKTIEICNSYEQKDHRIKVYHKANGGICDARNYGISMSSGSYIAFCDHDDAYDLNLLECVAVYLEERNVDVVHFSHKIIHNGQPDTIAKACLEVTHIKNTRTYLGKLLNNYFFENVWCNIYSRSLLHNSAIRFDTVFKHGGEDFDFNIRLFPSVKDILLLPDVLYTHFYRETSTSFKLYDDILYNFISKQEKVNDIVKYLDVEESAYALDYISYSGLCVISILSYGMRMKKAFSEMRSILQQMRENIHAWPSAKLVLFAPSVKQRVTMLVLILLKIRFYALLYLANLYFARCRARS